MNDLDATPRPRHALVAVAVLALVAAACAVVLLSGSGTSTYTVRLADAGQLVRGDEVRVGGRAVGSVREVRLAPDRRAEVEFEVDEPVAPLRAGTRLRVRAASLTGIANRYIALDPGPATGLELPDGAQLPAASAAPLVELDAVLGAFDPQTREGLRGTVRGMERQLRGRGPQANRAAEAFDPALQAVRDLAADLSADTKVLRRFVAAGSEVVGALSTRRDALARSVRSSGDALDAVAREDDALARALDAAPAALRSTTGGLADLRAALPDLERVVATAADVAPGVTPLLRDLRPTLRGARPVLTDLAPAVDDLTLLLRRTPRLASRARPALRDVRGALEDSLEVVRFARPYAPDLVGLLRDLGQSTAAYDANGHYARVQPVFNAFETLPGGVLAPRTGSRLQGFETLQTRRCPGGASAPRADGSAPWRDVDGRLDCDPSTSPGTP